MSSDSGPDVRRETISLAEFATRKGLNPVRRRGFETFVRWQLGTFDLRTEAEWARHYRTFSHLRTH